MDVYSFKAGWYFYLFYPLLRDFDLFTLCYNFAIFDRVFRLKISN